MITFYFDTSAIVKRYHKEIGSDILDKIFELKDGFAKFLLKVTLCI
jgi:predicted nucleic acid-binding protein